MRFLYPELLFLLLLPVLLAVPVLYRTHVQRKKLKEFGRTDLVRDLMPDLSLRRKLGKDLILLFAFTLMILALARPQMGAKTEKVKLEGIEMMVALDISNSMRATDASPSRLALARNIVSRMIDKMSNNKIGLIFFAGDAFVQMPITTDFISAKMFLDNASPDLIEAQGTEIGKAVRMARRSFSKDNKAKKAIVIITDGENHDGNAIGEVEAAKKEGILVSVIGVGTEEGGPIKMDDGNYLTDENGQMVVTKLNTGMAKEIASAAGGVFIHAEDVSGSVRAIQKSLEKLEKTELESTIYSAYNEVYQYFLFPAILLLVLEFVILDRKNRYFERMKLFERKERK
ncbi:MAG: VWA domain-containing protein [Porphyromonas sp.]|nr:VWA domain-containing protein [Bacteroidales bacterium]MDD7559298.1 VWA domain-containing protein [Bacteroidales bacterium]MDY3101442.1 VWA domain-containing protein [Porphyromonas sp.]